MCNAAQSLLNRSRVWAELYRSKIYGIWFPSNCRLSGRLPWHPLIEHFAPFSLQALNENSIIPRIFQAGFYSARIKFWRDAGMSKIAHISPSEYAYTSRKYGAFLAHCRLSGRLKASRQYR
jgi:hypothetical protein